MMTNNTGQSQELVRPPQWAASILALLLPPGEAETVSGDLIEEYRDTVHPSSGQWRAEVWYVRQVAGFAWRAASTWGLLLAAFLTGRFLLDTFAPPATWGPRSFFTTWSSILLYLLAGSWGAWRTGRARAGILVAVGVHLIASSVSAAVTVAVFVGVIRHQPAMLSLFQQTGDWGEVWSLPLMVLPVVMMIGALGGVFGRSLPGRVLK